MHTLHEENEENVGSEKTEYKPCIRDTKWKTLRYVSVLLTGLPWHRQPKSSAVYDATILSSMCLPAC